MAELRNVVENELKLGKTKDSLALPIDMSASSSEDSEMTRALKKQMELNREQHVSSVAEIAAEVIQSSTELRKSKIEEARALRKRAKELTSEATALYNAEATLIAESRLAPLAYLLGRVTHEQRLSIKASLDKKPLKAYWDERKKAQNSAKAG